MNNYVLLVLLAYLIYGISYYVDDALMTKIKVKNSIGNLMIASSLLSGLVLFPIFFYLSEFNLRVDFVIGLLIITATLVWMMAMLLYYLSLKYLIPNVVSILYQLIPVFNFIFSLIMGHSFSFVQVGGIVLIVSSAIMLSLGQKVEMKRLASLFMVLSSFCFALFYVIFNELSVRTGFYQATALYQIGMIIFGLSLLINNKMRRDFIDTVVKKPMFLLVNVINKTMSMISNLLINYAMLFIPIALVSSLVGVDPIMTFVVGFVGVRLLPKYVDHAASKKEIIKMLLAITMTVTGIYLMFIA